MKHNGDRGYYGGLTESTRDAELSRVRLHRGGERGERDVGGAHFKLGLPRPTTTTTPSGWIVAREII